MIIEEIPDGACLQMGIGAMPNAVGAMIAESDLKDLGVHTEMYIDAFADIAMNGGSQEERRLLIRDGRCMHLQPEHRKCMIISMTIRNVCVRRSTIPIQLKKSHR